MHFIAGISFDPLLTKSINSYAMKKKVKIMVVEDDLFYNKILEKHLNQICKGYNYPDLDFKIAFETTVTDANEKIESDFVPDILILDYYLDGEGDSIQTGMEVLKKVKKKNPQCKAIIISGQKNMETTAELMINGADEYITKDNFSTNRLWSILSSTLSHVGK